MANAKNTSLAVFYRPKEWEEVCGQASVVKILKQQVLTESIKNAYLFCGASGAGKTTLARIFANKINGGVGEPIEIDAASHNGVDGVRELIKSAQERAIDAKYKVIICDEVHALTTQAWQAFLKCLEEPPQYTVFIFCTTDPQKIPNTILNRVQRFNITRLPFDAIKRRLDYICSMEGYVNYEDATEYIAKISDGGMRDAIATLEKCASYSNDLSLDNVLVALGNYSYQTMFDLVNAMIDGDEKRVLGVVGAVYNDGGDLRLFVDMFLSFCMDIEKYILFSDMLMTRLPSSMEDMVKASINFDNPIKVYDYLVNKVLELKNMLKGDSNVKTTTEVCMINMSRFK